MDYHYLPTLNSPADLRALSVEALPCVCRELRDDIVHELSVNPGHLASSLGVVELTVALHYVYDTPSDRIVWDVGHQAYGHKILTGRRDAFHTNRKLGGLHPFPTPAESEYDTFTCGHASNSISAALGMAVADADSRRHVVAVIGDGAMSGGLAFEGLNNASSSPNDLLIILNDNNMSIDRSVGGMKQYLLSLNTNETYNRYRNNIARWLTGHGWLNDRTRKKTLRFGNALKSALLPQPNVFEGMDIRYFGPIDGHNVVELVRVLRHLRDMRGPKLLHVHTVKGKGYAPAEHAATIWHAPGRFDPDTGERLADPAAATLPPRFQDVFGDTLVELAKADPRIVGVTPAMPTGCSMNKLMAAMPDRAYDVGIAEGHAVTFSAGMATEGRVPFCNIYSAFAQRAYDNIIHDVAIAGLHVVFCLDRAGLVGEDGATHHGAFDLAALRPIPGLTICSPMDADDLRQMMRHAAQATGPVVIRYPRGRDSRHLPLPPATGTSARLVSGNADTATIALLTIGPIGWQAEQAIAHLTTEQQTHVVHYDMRYLRPLDTDVLRHVAQHCQRVVTVEDGVRNGGLGSAVLEWCADNGCAPHITRLGLPTDTFVEHGTVAELQHLCGIDWPAIKQCIVKL